MVEDVFFLREGRRFNGESDEMRMIFFFSFSLSLFCFPRGYISSVYFFEAPYYLKKDYKMNLSILVILGKENNDDFSSNGE